MTQHEHTLNVRIGDALRGMRRRWRVSIEDPSATTAGHRRPDLLLTEPGAAPLVIEHETHPAPGVESDALRRLGMDLSGHRHPVRAAIALRSPAELRQLQGAALAGHIRDSAAFEYALFRGLIPADAERWPARGWLRGSLQDLALLAQQAMRPSEEIDRLAEILERDIELARQIFSENYPEGHAQIAALFAEHLRLEDGPQTRRMAMAILANALIFQQSLAGHEDYAAVRTPEQLYSADRLHKTEILQDWGAILAINYYPIFHVAREILRGIDRTAAAQAILTQLYHIIEAIVREGAARSHDLAGFVFQRLIADRKFLATFYTRPESAALLAALALPNDGGWGDAERLRQLRVADFACGTGTLLAAVYARLGALHELAGGDAQALHRAMLERVLVGCDVLPMAVHLTLSMLAAAYPEETFSDCTMLAMPYGKQDTGEYALGSLDLLATQVALPTLATRPEAVEGAGQRAAAERHTIADESYDLVIMNPPFTRPGGHEGKKVGVSVPAFAGLQNTKEEQRVMSKNLSDMARGICYDGKAGLGSGFVALAHKKLNQAGILAFVLPVTVIQGEAWRKVRRLLSQNYRDITVITIAQPKYPHNAFSDETGMGECLLFAHRTKIQREEKRREVQSSEKNRATFVCLDRRPRGVSEGELLGNLIHEMKNRGLRKLEDEITSDTLLHIGQDRVGSIIEAPIDENPWRIEAIRDMAVAQTAHHLSHGHVLLPHWTTGTAIPMTQVKELAEIGPYHQELYRTDGEGAFEKIDSYEADAYYPMLWSHDAPKERCFIVAPDSHGLPIDRDRALKLAKTASHVHHNRDFRFNSQSLSACWTESKTLGGRAWPSLLFHGGEVHEKAYVVWANSTWGILCYWWHATKQQSGRGMIPVTALPALPTLDLRALSDEQLTAAGRIFHDHKQRPMLPINQIDEDENRAELDRRLLTEVLGLPAALCTGAESPLALLRRKLAAEPSIHGGKKSKVVL
ncbi:MAG: hypothetical protein OXF83_06670 [Anaerolineaceae bacterium]|nr:hypothetical protein [Anaerolineaceae bacterium]